MKLLSNSAHVSVLNRVLTDSKFSVSGDSSGPIYVFTKGTVEIKVAGNTVELVSSSGMGRPMNLELSVFDLKRVKNTITSKLNEKKLALEKQMLDYVNEQLDKLEENNKIQLLVNEGETTNG